MVRRKKITAALAAAMLLAAPACSSTRKNNQPAVNEPAGEAGSRTGHAEPKTAPDAKAAAKDGKVAMVWKTAVKPKALSHTVNKGLAWLAKHQLPNGAWGQGDESAGMGQDGGNLRATPSVADTAMALLTFLRAGNTPAAGEFKNSVRRGFEYVLDEIEASDADSLYVTQTRGTRVQSKIGTYVDTFAALMVMTEAKGTMGSEQANKRLDKALAKVLAKIEKNQRADGSWDNQGWAPVLTDSMAAKGLNRAAQSGADVKEEVLARVERQNEQQFDKRSGSFATGKSAGVNLYGGAAGASSARDSANTRRAKEPELKRRAAATKDQGEKSRIQAELAAGERAVQQAEAAEVALLDRVDDDAFIRGFGNNGGEEFLSYMLIAESLVVKGGGEWEKWDASITKLVNQVQNEDGSWTGHHCITGRTFCTAAALLVLMADRAPVPMAAKLRRG
jgi:Prenyltransferase and squalene oxidase repeat